MEDRRITVGFIRRPHGLKGELLFSADVPDYSFFLRIKEFTLKTDRETKTVSVESVRGGAKRHIIKFAGLDSLDAVEGLGGAKLETWGSIIPPLPEGEYYHFDIVGMHVYLEDRTGLGSIVEILETGANDVYVVRDEAGSEHLIPATKEVVKRVDVKKREIVISPLEGMIEDV